MEILVITWNYAPRRGGMERLLANVCGGLSKNHRVSVITAYAGETIEGGDEIIYRPAAAGLLRFFLFVVVKGMALLQRNHAIQIVFGGSVLVTPIVWLLARLFRRKSVVQAHGLDLIYRNAVYQLLIVNWLRYVDRVIANSHHTARLAQQKGVAERAIVVILPGVDWQRFQVAESAEALKQAWGLVNRKVILFVGRLARRKGVKEFIEHSLVDIVKRGPDVCFLIAGENPTESLAHHDDVAGGIRQSIERYDLSCHVRWLGAVSDSQLVQLYALCDVVVLPVLDLGFDVEGFGMVALEAAAAGKPVVATRAGGITDAVEDEKSGILVDPGGYKELTRAVTTILNDEVEQFIIGTYARERVKREFSWDHVVELYAEVFSSFDDVDKSGVSS
jgi:phosphatidyl-myo-inositol dimannoside synthase